MKRFVRISRIAVIIAVALFTAAMISGGTIANLYHEKAVGVRIVPEESGFSIFTPSAKKTIPIAASLWKMKPAKASELRCTAFCRWIFIGTCRKFSPENDPVRWKGIRLRPGTQRRECI